MAKCPIRNVNGTEIIGKGQVTNGPGGMVHGQLSELLANKLAMTGKFKKIFLHRPYKTATGISTIPKRSPDLIAIGRDGKVHVIELASPSDMLGNKFNELLTRNATALSQLPNSMQGGSIIRIANPFNARQIKTIIDSWLSGI